MPAERMLVRRSGTRGSARMWWVATILCAALAGCGGTKQSATVEAKTEAAAAPQAQDNATPQYTVRQEPGGLVEGRVLWEGTPPPRKITVMENIEVCGMTREVYALRMENGGVDDAVVWIDDVQHGKPFAFPPAEIAQRSCSFVPEILLMQAGDVKIGSQDPIPHNVHTYSQQNPEYNEAMSRSRREISLHFAHPDIVSIRCDLHQWMQAYAVVAKNPYYTISGNGGAFQLDEVPPGRYHLMVWSKSLGESEQDIVVKAGKTTKADFDLKDRIVQDPESN
jgi:hypothetical protein